MIQNDLRGTSLFLVGMMGAGKTSVGRILARKLGYRFCDTDGVIEQAVGKPITQIFEESGEAEFRQLETQVLGEVASFTRMAIATGGGIVTTPKNWSYLQHGVVIWLDVPVDRLYQRLRRDTTRPLLQHPDPEGRLRELLEQRRSLYAQADVRVEVTGDETSEQVADMVLGAIVSILKQPHNPDHN
jgi:shikimate kinase